ncbi:uncharacterized protein DUF2786 [Streptomyces sp. BK022]|uniref:DUF2786 domain-containing protein n=1 Tax=Streptomyces sp. BK022 TaxID=2512123 RepID=UPI00102976B4|nr:DUF2786 domain-containing protein [Streptomyces sp. BK022]RZU36001.1 uncharacterized protein DUF2786 [Streptomyces sp. BK022]
MSDKMLDKLAKILNQAENASTPEEAATFMKKAQALATLTSIDLAVARQHTAKREQREQPTHKTITIGQPRKNNNARLVNLFIAIADQNDVKVNIAMNSTFVIAFGMPSDIEVVEALYASLLYQMTEAANAWLKLGEYKKETVLRRVTKRDAWGPYKDLVERPMDGRTARANFYEAFTNRISSRLWEARQEALEKVKKNVYTLPTTGENGVEYEVEVSAALVLKEKSDEVKDYYEKASTAKGSWKGAGSTAHTSTTARRAGDEAGQSARLGSAKAIGGQRTSIAA